MNNPRSEKEAALDYYLKCRDVFVKEKAKGNCKASKLIKQCDEYIKELIKC